MNQILVNKIYKNHLNELSGIVLSDMQKIYLQLSDAKKFYPNFEDWYLKKVVPDLVCGQRILISEIRDNNIAGLAILKVNNEKKLSTLKVTSNYLNKGIGLKLFEKSFQILETEKPFLTVSEEKLVEFKKIFDYYNFKLTSTHDSLYRSGKKEYFFNEY